MPADNASDRPAAPHDAEQIRAERLEARRFLDAGSGFSLADGTLSLDAGDGTADVVQFHREGLDLVGTWQTTDDAGAFSDAGVIRVPAVKVKGIRVTTGDGDDLIVAGRRRVPVTINAGLGDDTLVGGLRGDSLLGAGGNDSIVGGGGDDYLEGGNGDDRLQGAAGDDVVAPGRGMDSIHGAGGDDVVLLINKSVDAGDLVSGDIELSEAVDRSDVPAHHRALPAITRFAAARYLPDDAVDPGDGGELGVQMTVARGGDRFDVEPLGIDADGDAVFALHAAVWTGVADNPGGRQTFEFDVDEGVNNVRLIDGVTGSTLATLPTDKPGQVGRYLVAPGAI